MKRWYQPQGLILVVCALAAIAVGCGEKTSQEVTECVDDREFFQKEVWSAFMSSTCTACHVTGGAAQHTDLVLQPETQTGFIDANFAVVRDVASYQKDGTSILLLKPTNQIPHEGGLQIEEDGPEYQALVELLERFEEPTTCGDQTATESHFEGVVLMTPEETLRKATINLAGRLPTAGEHFRVATGGMDALDTEIDRLMLEESFYARLEQIFNDMFLVERYLGRTEAVDLLNPEYYPHARWFIEDDDNPIDFSQENQDFLAAAREYTNDSMAREPLELASYLVRNDRPFTEIVTADYILVNPFLARAYGIEDVQFEDPLDPNEWKPAKMDLPHAGVLTSPMWLNRFPTTDTNRNRHRSRMVFWFFLATDVMKLATRPIDPTSISGFNPTRENPNCNVCHKQIDPIAGLLQNWDDEGSYAPREEGWYPEMFSPGYGDTKLPDARYPDAAKYLGEQIATDRRFATSMVHHMYRGLTGQEPLMFPIDPAAPDYQHRLIQYEVQDQIFENIAQKFIDANYNLKVIIKELVKSQYFRAKDHTSDDEAVLAEVSELGMGRMLTPELLDKKIYAVTGEVWDDRDGERYLLEEDEYLILYGGIDSDDVTMRITDPNGIMTGIQLRMANEMACRTVARDFTVPPESRRYFPYVEPSYAPRDPNTNFDVDAAQAAIRKNIQHLHWHILGERLEEDDPEIQRTYDLFVQTWEEGNSKMGLEEGGVSSRLSCDAETTPDGVELPEEERIEEDENYVIRSWMAVVTYLLSDYRFLYE